MADSMYYILCSAGQCAQVKGRDLLMRFERELLKGTAQLAVLEVLSRGEMYGYELSKALSARSGEILTLGRGSLYPLLYNLEARQLVESRVRTADNGRERRYYRITARGLAQLAERKRQWLMLQQGIGLVLGRIDLEGRRRPVTEPA